MDLIGFLTNTTKPGNARCIEIGLTKEDYSLLLDRWELETVYPKNTAMKIKKELKEHAEKLFLKNKGDIKAVKIRFFELGKKNICWIETFCRVRLKFPYYGPSTCEGTLNLQVEAIIDRDVYINVPPQEV